jgi:predicted PurR-regulated permease PerM
LGSFVRFVVPSVAAEVNRMIENLPATEATLIETKNRLVRRYPALREPINGYLRSALADDRLQIVELQLISERQRLNLSAAEVTAAAENPAPPTGALAEYFNRQDQLLLNALVAVQRQRVSQYAPTVTVMLYRATATTLLALLFSYLILIDLNRIKAGISRLRNSRVGDFYEEAAPPIARFGILLGRAIEAQAAIAVVNTVLTLVGLLLLDIPSCSFAASCRCSVY